MNRRWLFVDARRQRSPWPWGCFSLVILLLAVVSSGHATDLDPARSCRDSGEAPSLSTSAPAFGGDFYGSPFTGVTTANARIRRYQNGMMFRAERTGRVDAIRYQNRLLTDEIIEGRCRKVGEPWCNCLENDLDKNACGWTMSNMYHAGNGGLQVVSLHHDDDSEQHWPDERTTLAKSSPYYPIDFPADRFLTVKFQAPVSLIKGRYYHLVWTNSDVAPSREITKRENSVAASWSENYGAFGLNGWAFHPQEKTSNPVYRHNKVYGRDDPGEPFSIDENNLPFYGIRYVDGHWLGDVYTRLHAEVPGKGGYTIGGDGRARQTFVAEGVEKEVDGVWAFMRLEASAIVGAVTATINDSKGKVLSSAVFANDRLSADGGWVYQALSSPVTFTPGAAYAIEFSAPPGTAVYMSANFPMDYPPYLAGRDRNAWGRTKIDYATAFAERSDDGGLSWTTFGEPPFLGRDLSVVFTISGKPKHVSLPGIELDNFLSFEESEQTWNDPSGSVIVASEHSGNDIEGSRYRGVATVKRAVAAITEMAAYTGCRSLQATTEAIEDGGALASLAALERGRSWRRMRQGVDYWSGFAMKNLVARHDADWEIYAMWHDPSAPPPGWGETGAPQVALHRLDDDSYGIVYRHNRSDGSTIVKRIGDLPLFAGEWQRFVFHLRLDNQDGGDASGVLEVWTAVDGEPLKRYVDLHDINIGFRYSDGNAGPVPMLVVYNGEHVPTSHKVYFDDWRISSDDEADEHAVDPSTYR